MSVQKDRRKETPASLPMMSVKHAKYVIQITRNPKVFDPQYNHEVTDDLVREAKGIHRAIWGANQVKVTSRERYSDRRKQQEEAVKLCRDLLSDIAIAKSKKGLLPKESVDESYRSWRDHASKGNSYNLLKRMDKYYEDLWRNDDAENHQETMAPEQGGRDQPAPCRAGRGEEARRRP